MNNKGFTLIELIATIALLAIIAVISFVSITEVVNKSRVSDCENIKKSIITATKEYVSDNRYSFSNNNSFNITAELLISKNYLSSPIINPFTNEEIDDVDIKIVVELNDDYTAKKITIGAPEILKICKSE